mmetsp:Transcript_31557/g.69069  ORF Transcript_31557/g.69069 Transcript_31557/m.69069 type:complete len:274 (-) Transcript_31557:143-964(-)
MPPSTAHFNIPGQVPGSGAGVSEVLDCQHRPSSATTAAQGHRPRSNSANTVAASNVSSEDPRSSADVPRGSRMGLRDHGTSVWGISSGIMRVLGGGNATSRPTTANAFAEWEAIADMHSDLRDFLMVFRFFDCDHRGKLSGQQLRAVFLSLGQLFSEEEIDKMIGDVAPDADAVDFTEFLALMSSPAKGPSGGTDVGDEVLEAFKIVDSDGDGFISQQDLLCTLQSSGEPVSRHEIALMIEDVGEEESAGEIMVNYDQFQAMLGYRSPLKDFM